MVQIDIPVAFGTAGVFAAAVEQGLKSERRGYFYQRALAVSLIFQLFLVVWLPVYLLIAHFGFQTSHMWWKGDSITEHPWLLPAFLTAYFVACIGGFHLGSVLVTRGQRKMVWVLFAGGFAFFAAWMAFQPYRTLTLGSYAEWQAQTAQWIWKTPSFVGLLTGAMVVFFIALRIVYKRLQREAATAA
jgi:hypothetical protein